MRGKDWIHFLTHKNCLQEMENKTLRIAAPEHYQVRLSLTRGNLAHDLIVHAEQRYTVDIDDELLIVHHPDDEGSRYMVYSMEDIFEITCCPKRTGRVL